MEWHLFIISCATLIPTAYARCTLIVNPLLAVLKSHSLVFISVLHEMLPEMSSFALTQISTENSNFIPPFRMLQKIYFCLSELRTEMLSFLQVFVPRKI